jgi:uncharacterized protein (DUF2461 family)
MVESPDEYLAVVENRRFKKEFGGVQGEKLAKAPLGYPKDHLMIEHLKHKQFFVGREYEDESMCLRPKFLNLVVHVFSDTMPLVQWLAKAVK